MMTSAVIESHLKELDKEVQRSCKAKQAFERLVLSKEEAMDIFGYNPFKRWVSRESCRRRDACYFLDNRSLDRVTFVP